MDWKHCPTCGHELHDDDPKLPEGTVVCALGHSFERKLAEK